MRLLGLAMAFGVLAGAPAFGAPAFGAPTGAASAEMARLRAEAARVTIVRDDWGVAHVHGPRDADAVFGMAYAQAEDDFNRVEANYLTNLGRTAEAEGPKAVWQDLRQKLYVDPTDLKAKYVASPAWLKALMDSWADGLNFYLATHPDVKPKVITHFEPWMALSFTEGSIGGDIERISLSELEAFYGGAKSASSEPLIPAKAGIQMEGRERRTQVADRSSGHPAAPYDLGPGLRRDEREANDPYAFREPSGSNGIAIGPGITKDGHALLLINPHTSFFFRSELQMQSDEGLDAYGAVTWGQFFIYQGFNAHAGWMHTSSGVDVVDEFAETIVKQGGKVFYRYGKAVRPVTASTVTVAYKAADGSTAHRSFTVYRTHHGPIVRSMGDKWVAFAMMYKPVEALQQSFLRTKATDYASFAKVAELKANSSNNTLFADDKGETAYLHPQFIPRRDDRFDYTRPVDGSDPATDWKGLTPTAAAPQVLNPKGGWVYNSNNAPWTAAGAESPKRDAFPKYMDQAGENPRGPHAVRVLSGRTDFTREGLLKAAFDPWLPAFARLIPGLAAAYDALPEGDPMKARLKDQVAALRVWDDRWAAGSTETSLAVFWGEALWAKAAPGAKAARMSVWDFMAEKSPPADKLAALAEASDRLVADFGGWKTPWGEINRFQRLNDDIVQTFHDDQPSIPVPFTSAQWGSLASFGAKRYPGTKRYYGTSGNSFVAVVEFGPKVRALAVTAGGESGHPGTKHFDDQAERYASGDLREVYFHPEQLQGHTERTYRPGE